MNHDLRITVYDGTKFGLVEKAVARADDFYGPGNWREDTTADVRWNATDQLYYATYYFTDVPLIDERTIADD